MSVPAWTRDERCRNAPGRGSTCSVCRQPPPVEFPTTSPASPWDHQKEKGVRVNYQQPPTRETKQGDDLLGPRGDHPTIWTTGTLRLPIPNNTLPRLSSSPTQQPCSPKCLASAHRHTPFLSDPPTPSHRSQTVRPDAKLRLPLPSSQPGSPRGQLPGIYLHKQPLSPTTTLSRSDAS